VHSSVHIYFCGVAGTCALTSAGHVDAGAHNENVIIALQVPGSFFATSFTDQRTHAARNQHPSLDNRSRPPRASRTWRKYRPLTASTSFSSATTICACRWASSRNVRSSIAYHRAPRAAAS
jgi:hypothetical protein